MSQDCDHGTAAPGLGIARSGLLQGCCGTGGGVKAGILDLDTTMPGNPYTKFQKLGVIVCDSTCSPP